MGCQRQAAAETRSKAESPEGKSIGIPIFPSESSFFYFFSKNLKITVNI
jgi:hypothetical protein